LPKVDQNIDSLQRLPVPAQVPAAAAISSIAARPDIRVGEVEGNTTRLQKVQVDIFPNEKKNDGLMKDFDIYYLIYKMKVKNVSNNISISLYV
jgi:hypothetical protein